MRNTFEPVVRRDVADVAISGLTREQKTLPAKLFYDEEGCRLFQRITELPEYYLTRTELTLLPQVAPQVMAEIGQDVVIVEYGASDEKKVEFLLNARDISGHRMVRAYVPIDVATTALERMRARLQRNYPELVVYTLAADFMDVAALPRDILPLPRLGFFPGSTIGNLDPSMATRFLRQAGVALGAPSHFLIGVDMCRDSAVLLPAYDDAAGVTAAFNRNMLTHLNREAAADFDTDAFSHRAVWNPDQSRIEMHLVSRRDQHVRVAGHAIHFTRGETIHTENSYKYSRQAFIDLAAAAGWYAGTIWTDPGARYAVYLLRRG